MRFVRRFSWLVLLALLVVSALAPWSVQGQALGEDDLAPVRQGFDLLLDRFVVPVDSRTLLEPAWRAAAEAGGQAEFSQAIPAPLFTGDREADWALFREHWPQLVARAAHAVSAQQLAQAALTAMAEAVDEPHTVYLSPSRFAEYLAWARGDVRYAGIGARLSGVDPTVVEVFENSPAADAGLQVGDVITHVDREPVLGRDLSETVERVRGLPGSVVEVTVQRAGLPEPLALHLVRSEITLALVQARLLRDRVGYLLIRGFPEESVVQQAQEALADLQAQGAQALVLDLRGNSGGRLDVGTRLLSQFVPEGPIYQQAPRLGPREIAYATAGVERVELPLVVLVDSGTASMGEIFAAAVQERSTGVIVGEATAGSVAAAHIYPLDDGSALQVTVMEITSGEGRQLNGVGVVPDVPVENSLEALRRGIDLPLETALDLVAPVQWVPAMARYAPAAPVLQAA